MCVKYHIVDLENRRRNRHDITELLLKVALNKQKAYSNRYRKLNINFPNDDQKNVAPIFPFLSHASFSGLSIVDCPCGILLGLFVILSYFRLY